MKSANSIVEQKAKIEDEFEKYVCSSVDGLERATLYFEPMLTQFYDDLSLHLIERKEQEKDEKTDYKDSVEWFYYKVRPNSSCNHLFKNFLQEYKTGNDIIDHLVFETRKKICGNPIQIGKEYYTEQQCGIASTLLQKDLNKFSDVYSMRFATSYSFGIPNNEHAFNFVNMGDKNYIIDCTFSQFTKLYRMNLGIIKLPKEIINAEPSYFLLQTEEGKVLLEKLLTGGYFEATAENLKLYLDAFLLSNRNGYYYLNNDASIFETGISKDYYVNELNSMLELGIENKCHSYANIEVPDIFGLKNISYTDAYFSKDEIKKINKKLLK